MFLFLSLAALMGSSHAFMISPNQPRLESPSSLSYAMGSTMPLPKEPMFGSSAGTASRVMKRVAAPGRPAHIQEVMTMEEYNKVVAQEKDQVVVVRFFAPWCRVSGMNAVDLYLSFAFYHEFLSHNLTFSPHYYHDSRHAKRWHHPISNSPRISNNEMLNLSIVPSPRPMETFMRVWASTAYHSCMCITQKLDWWRSENYRDDIIRDLSKPSRHTFKTRVICRPTVAIARVRGR